MAPTAAALDFEQLAALHRVALTVARDAPPDEVFAVVTEQAAGMLSSEASGVLRFLGEERAVVLGAWIRPGTRGLPVNAELDFDARNSALGRMRLTRQPARADSYEESSGELPLIMRASGLRSSLAAPVIVHGDLWGALVVATAGEQPLPPGTEARLPPFAELVAQALINAEARRGLVTAGDEARRELERALHKGPKQQLLSLQLKLRVALGKAPPGSEQAALIEDALAEATAAGASLTELARGLHPAVLMERGIAAAVQALAARAAVPVFMRELPARRFDTTAETTAYAVVAAAVAGSKSSEVVVAVADRGHQLLVEVAGGSCDLRTLTERVAAVGGRLEVGEAAVRAVIPVGPVFERPPG
jgi:GAF domain-containing protein